MGMMLETMHGLVLLVCTYNQSLHVYLGLKDSTLLFLSLLFMLLLFTNEVFPSFPCKEPTKIHPQL